jgi:hypothetical protein
MNSNRIIAELQSVRDDLARMKDVVGTLIAWVAQSANAPIRADEARQLLERLVNRDQT